MKLLVRSVVAAALAVTTGPTMAATAALGVGSYIVSSTEGNIADAAANAADTVAISDITVTPAGTGYTVGDVVTLTFNGGTLPAGSFGIIGTTTIACNDATPAAVFTLRLAGVTGSTATFNVIQRDSTLAVNTATCIFSGATLLSSSLTTPKTVTFNYTAQTSAGVVHDALRAGQVEGNPVGTLPVHFVDSQFSAIAPTLSNARLVRASSGTGYAALQRFTANSANAATTSVSFATDFDGSAYGAGSLYITGALVSVPAGVQQNLIPTAGLTLTTVYTGDFSFVDNNGDGCTAADLTTGWGRIALTVGAAAQAPTISADCRTITNVGAGDRIETLTFSVGNSEGSTTSVGAREIPRGSYTTVGTWRDGLGAVVGSASSITPISLSVNAFTAEVPYMPYGAGISRILYITNRSTTTGAVSISARNEAGTSCPTTSFPAVSARASSVTLLSAAVDAGIATCYGAGFEGKVRLNFTVNIPPQSADTVSMNATSLSPKTAVGGVNLAAAPLVDAATIGAGVSAAIAATTGTVTRAVSAAEIYSAYNVNGNRVTVINTSNGR